MRSWEISFAHSIASCVVYSTNNEDYVANTFYYYPSVRSHTILIWIRVRVTLVIERNPNFYSQFSALAFKVSVIAALIIITDQNISHTRRRVGVRRQIHTGVCALRFHSCVSTCRHSCAFFEFSCWRRRRRRRWLRRIPMLRSNRNAKYTFTRNACCLSEHSLGGLTSQAILKRKTTKKIYSRFLAWLQSLSSLCVSALVCVTVSTRLPLCMSIIKCDTVTHTPQLGGNATDTRCVIVYRRKVVKKISYICCSDVTDGSI